MGQDIPTHPLTPSHPSSRLPTLRPFTCPSIHLPTTHPAIHPPSHPPTCPPSTHPSLTHPRIHPPNHPPTQPPQPPPQPGPTHHSPPHTATLTPTPPQPIQPKPTPPHPTPPQTDGAAPQCLLSLRMPVWPWDARMQDARTVGRCPDAGCPDCGQGGRPMYDGCTVWGMGGCTGWLRIHAYMHRASVSVCLSVRLSIPCPVLSSHSHCH